ncbi:hypothetical protein OAN94_00330 [Verrucomicrobiales bacterium]|jgi:hypothetical protein|nr:hypothetical protein [Verrucomicrobiales bacterium]
MPFKGKGRTQAPAFLKGFSGAKPSILQRISSQNDITIADSPDSKKTLTLIFYLDFEGLSEDSNELWPTRLGLR